MKVEKGIILAGGTGSRLYPLTVSANKQLLPIYDKPVIYYPLTTLMLAGIKEILIISTPRDLEAIENHFGTGSHLGMNFSYEMQQQPRGLSEAFILGESFINNQPVAMILGDNFFHGHGLTETVYNSAQNLEGAHIFTYTVEDPGRYGVILMDENEQIVDIEEKPINPKSNQAITGLYYFDGTVSQRAKQLRPSQRNELEITDLIKTYIQENRIKATQLGRGYVWFDVGTSQSLLDASNYVQVIQSRQGVAIASPEEVAWRMGFIDKAGLQKIIQELPTSKYRHYLDNLSLS
ncbi:MAG: glucose-1-phosphate thymidylyltransferase RfbA [Candidatus Paracaedibacter sp.]